jgi:hypothetical protein
MSATKRLRGPLIVILGALMAVLTFAGPASAVGPYPPSPGVQVLGTSASTGTGTNASGTTTSASGATATGGLAFTGTNAIGIGALGGLLLVGGGAMVLVGKRRKVNS